VYFCVASIRKKKSYTL